MPCEILPTWRNMRLLDIINKFPSDTRWEERLTWSIVGSNYIRRNEHKYPGLYRLEFTKNAKDRKPRSWEHFLIVSEETGKIAFSQQV